MEVIHTQGESVAAYGASSTEGGHSLKLVVIPALHNLFVVSLVGVTVSRLTAPLALILPHIFLLAALFLMCKRVTQSAFLIDFACV